MKTEPSYIAPFAAAFSRNKFDSMMYRHTVARAPCPVCAMMLPSGPASITADVAKPVRKLGPSKCTIQVHNTPLCSAPNVRADDAPPGRIDRPEL